MSDEYIKGWNDAVLKAAAICTNYVDENAASFDDPIDVVTDIGAEIENLSIDKPQK